MTIQRNGKTYELTDGELFDAYLECRRDYAKCDIIEKYDQLIEDDCIANEALTDEALEKFSPSSSVISTVTISFGIFIGRSFVRQLLNT